MIYTDPTWHPDLLHLLRSDYRPAKMVPFGILKSFENSAPHSLSFITRPIARVLSCGQGRESPCPSNGPIGGEIAPVQLNQSP